MVTSGTKLLCVLVLDLSFERLEEGSRRRSGSGGLVRLTARLFARPSYNCSRHRNVVGKLCSLGGARSRSARQCPERSGDGRVDESVHNSVLEIERSCSVSIVRIVL